MMEIEHTSLQQASVSLNSDMRSMQYFLGIYIESEKAALKSVKNQGNIMEYDFPDFVCRYPVLAVIHLLSKFLIEGARIVWGAVYYPPPLKASA